MEKKDVSIQSIKILMGKREVELTIEEARKLKSALEEIFGVKVDKQVEHIYHYKDYYRYYDWNRFYCVDNSPKKFDFGTVYCSTAKGMDNTSNAKMMNQTLCLDIK